MLTINEKKVLKVLIYSFGEDFSINEISRKCSIAPNGALKILRKFQKVGILSIKKISNIASYKINFQNNKTHSIIELVLIDEFKGRVNSRYLDLLPLKKIVDSCILFGSYLNKENPNDLDLIFIIKRKDFNKFKELTKELFLSMPIKVHEIIQTKEDFVSNIKNKDPVVLESLKKGLILWGQKLIIETIEDANSE